jgi:small-conductance mechanosensitive channel
MLAQFTADSLWILIVTLVVLILLLISKHQFQNLMKKRAEAGIHHETLGKNVNLTVWVIGIIDLAALAGALAAIVISREGVHAMVTPETIQKWALQQGTGILVILLVGIGLWFALERFLPPIVRRSVAKAKGESKEGIEKRRHTLLVVFMGLGKTIICIAILFLILSELNVQIGPILAGFGIAGIAVGFGAQYFIRDLIAGTLIILENQYRVGDVAKVADITGVVEEINLRKTVLRDLDGIVHHVPNGEIRVASNYTRHFARVNLNVSVAYGTDLDHAISVMNRVGQELFKDANWSSLIRTAPEVLRVDNLGDSGIDIKIWGDVKPLQQWAVTGELRKRIKKAFDEEGIEIPWPHVKLYFGQSQNSPELICPSCAHANLPGSKFCANCGTSLSAR